MKTENQKKKLIEELEKNPIIEFACRRSGVARSTYYRWIARSRKFAEKAEKALERGTAVINDLVDAQFISLIKDKNFPAMKFWALRRHPAYSDKIKVIKSAEPEDDGKLDPKERELLKKAIELDFGKGWNKKPEEVRTIRISKDLAYNVLS